MPPSPSETLQPWFAPAAPRPPGRAAIIGAGVAGASAAYALRRRGWDVTLIDRHPEPAMEASGNPVGILMPRVTADDGIEGRLHTAAWCYMLETLVHFDATDMHWRQSGVLQIATDDADARRLAAIAACGTLPQTYLQYLEPEEASALAGCAITRPALFFPQGGTIAPRDMCRALIADTSLQQAAVAAIRAAYTGYDLVTADGAVCCHTDIVVHANALGTMDAAPWLPLTARRGQITLLPSTAASAPLRTVLATDVTVSPAIDGKHYLGATFDWTKDTRQPQTVRAADNARNFAALDPSIAALFAGVDPAVCDGRAALRCMTPDHLPVSGPLPDHAAYLSDYATLRHGQPWQRYPAARYMPGTYVLTGLGARGLVTALLSAELLACHISGEPWPIAQDLVTALHPGRFLVRDLKRLRV